MSPNRALNYQNEYRSLASETDIHALSGRRDRRDVTELVADRIIHCMGPWENQRVLDIGCGDGTLLRKLVSRGIASGVGTALSDEEVTRLRIAHADTPFLSFTRSILPMLPAFDMNFTRVICNGVLLLLDSVDDIRCSLGALKSVVEPGAPAWIGEVPYRAESADGLAISVTDMAALGNSVGLKTIENGEMIQGRMDYVMIRARTLDRGPSASPVLLGAALAASDFFVNAADLVLL